MEEVLPFAYNASGRPITPPNITIVIIAREAFFLRLNLPNKSFKANTDDRDNLHQRRNPYAIS